MTTTTMQSAFERAGFSKSEMELGAVAQRFFKSGGTLKRWIDIGTAAAERMPGKGHRNSVDQLEDADAGQAGGSGHETDETQTVDAAPARPLVPYAGKEKRKRKPQRQRTAAEKAAAISAGRFEVEIFHNYKLNPNMRWRELMVLARERADRAASGFMHSLQDTACTLFLLKMARHCVVTDDSVSVTSVISPTVQRRYDMEARREAPLLLKEASVQFHHHLIEADRNAGVTQQ